MIQQLTNHMKLRLLTKPLPYNIEYSVDRSYFRSTE